MDSTINDFFAQRIEAMAEIVGNLDSPFTSHHFFQKFAQKFEGDYIDFLAEYRSFQTVHSLIAKCLSTHADRLRIDKTGKEKSKNIFGELSDAEKWEKSQRK